MFQKQKQDAVRGRKNSLRRCLVMSNAPFGAMMWRERKAGLHENKKCKIQGGKFFIYLKFQAELVHLYWDS